MIKLKGPRVGGGHVAVALVAATATLFVIAPAAHAGDDGSESSVAPAGLPDGVIDDQTAVAPADAAVGGDIAVALSATASAPTAGHSFDWTIRIANNGPAPALGVSVSDVVPAPLIVTGVTATNFVCSAAGNSVSCLASNVAANAGGSIIISVYVPEDLAPTTVVDTASASSQTSDPNGANDAAWSSVGTQISLVDTPPPPLPAATAAVEAAATPRAVVASSAATLPNTGSIVLPQALAGFAALVLGGGLVAAARRRTAIN